ncbi:Uncharacterized conserved protein [Shimia gijangensis]|uniref:Uncharacterized conserved protein n=1 Tax=Shimia gijangensis TaxID=1470563 RepID=A0A1M6MVA7_9RHOB|nr:hypothetical protein [Shimia gijangensis]SHJ87435.1 Uncharacterized conserved protein [Shimia gijangensis]
MAKSKKTDKPDDAQTNEDTKVEEIIDAEVIEAQPEDSDQDDAPLAESEDPVGEPEDLAAENTVEESDAESAQLDAPIEAPQENSGSGFVPLVLGGVLAAGVGFAAASYLGSQGILFGHKANDSIAELTAKLEVQDDLIVLLKSNQDKIAETANAARDGVASAAESEARAAALSDRVEDLGAKLVTLEGRIIEAEKRPMTEGVSSTAIEAYEREVEQLRTLVSEQLAEAENLKENSTRTAQETLAQAALTRVISALDSGVPYRGPLTELAGATGASIPEALAAHADSGVTTNLALAEAFPAYARSALADARKQENANGGGGLAHFLKTQLGARSIEPKEGDDADAILSRAEAALREGRLDGALSELSALPETSQAVMADWRTLAETRVAAVQAVETLAQSLNSN